MTFLLFVIVVVLIIWIATINNRLHRLEDRFGMKGVPRPGAVPQPPVSAASAAGTVPHRTKLWAEPPAPVAHPAAAQPVHAMDVPVPVPHPEPAVPVSPAPQAPVRHSDLEVEARLATNWASKIGVVAILLGLAFFFKYAVDQGWIAPVTRIVIGFAVGGLFIALGWLWRHKYEKYANVIMGGGIAILYFTVYAGYSFYSLYSQIVALVLAVLVSALSVWLARLRGSAPLALLGLVGAYSSPLVFSSGQNRQIQLFVYLAALNVAVFLVLLKNYWTQLLYIGFFATMVDFVVWAVKYSGSNNEPISAVFLAVIASLFIIGLSALVRKHYVGNTLPNSLNAKLGIFTVLASATFLVISASTLYDGYKGYLALIAAIGGVAALLGFAIVDRLEYKGLNYCLALSGAGMILSSLAWYFDGKALALSLILVGLLGVAVAAVVKRAELRVAGVITLCLAIVGVLLQEYGPGKPLFIVNSKFGLMALEAAALFFASWLYRFFPQTATEKRAPEALNVVGVVLVWFAVALDAVKAYPGIVGQQVFTLVWILYPALILAIARKYRVKSLAILSLCMAAASMTAVLVLPYNPAHTAFIANIKFGLSVLQVLVLWFVIRDLGSDSEWQAWGTGTFLVPVAAVFFWIAASWDISEAFGGLAGSYALTLWWIVYPVIVAMLASVLHKKSLVWVSLMLMAIGFFKALGVPYDPDQYVFIWNSKFGLMALEAASMLMIAAYIAKYERQEPGSIKDTGAVNDALKIVASLFLWFAFSWELVHYFSGSVSTNTRNLSLSVWWIAYAAILIAYGAIMKSSVFRKVAIALFLISILKVFLYDVQTLDTGYRIVSFIVLGVILLSVSFAYQRNKEKIMAFLEGSTAAGPE